MKNPFFARFAPAYGAPRALKLGDAAACADLHPTGFAHGWSLADFEGLLSDPACVGDAIFTRDALSGFIVSRKALDEAEVLTVLVAPNARRQGLAARLLASHLARLAALGVQNLFLEVDEANAAALALYRRYGFAVEGRRKNYYAGAGGARSDALIMKREL